MNPARPDDARTTRAFLAGGLSGLAAATLAFICCATPALAMLLGAIGLGASTAVVGTTVDLAALPLTVVSLLLIGIGLRRRRRRSDTAASSIEKGS